MSDDDNKPWYETVAEDFEKNNSVSHAFDAATKKILSQNAEQDGAKPDYLDDEYLLLITRELRQQANDEILRQAKEDMQIIGEYLASYMATKISKKQFADLIDMPYITFRRLCKKYNFEKMLTEPQQHLVSVNRLNRKRDQKMTEALKKTSVFSA